MLLIIAQSLFRWLPLRRVIWCSLLLVTISMLIQSCGTTAPRQTQEENPYSDATRWEQLAEASTGEQRAVYQLSAAEAWYLSAEFERALFSLLNIDAFYLPSDELVDYSLLLSEIYQLQGRHQLALDALNIPIEQNRLTYAMEAKQASWAERTAGIYLALGVYEDAARYYDWAISLSEDEVILERLRKYLWRSLTLTENLPSPPYSSHEMTGWIDLAQMSNRNAGTLSEQLRQFQDWRFLNYSHPASFQPPESIQILESLANEPAPKVALLLPLTGNLATAGNAVLDGYLATVMENERRDPLNPSEILVFDTNAQSISAILREIRALDVQLVIGPLDKDSVTAFVALADPELRTLTLNSIEEQNVGIGKSVLGVALDIEDEARQAATAAMRDGHRTALSLVPNSTSGDRAAAAFAEVWEEQNGVLVATDSYDADETHAEMLETRLHVDQSNGRMRDLRTLLAQNLEFTARRRQDIDVLFLSATSEQARQIKPMLAFFFAEDIPVYSTSTIYDGIEDTKANRDLDGIKFSTLPWLISESTIQGALKEASPKTGSLLKLQAMGVDAYYLSQRIPQFLSAESTVYHGVLGKLSLEPGERNLDRQQAWAEFTGGIATPTP